MSDVNAVKLAMSRELPPAMMQGLGQFAEVVVSGPNSAAMEGCCIYVCTALDAVPAELINSMPESIKLIASFGVGTDHIDLAAAEKRRIQVSNTPQVTEDTADLTFTLILAACRRLSDAERLLRQGEWAQAQQRVGNRVYGKSLGIVGFGAIGQAVAQRAKGFDLKVQYYGPNRKAQAEAELGATYQPDLAGLLGSSDIVVLTCPLNSATQHLINAERLQQMKQGAVLVNTGRGAVVDEAALVECLREGHLAAAGLDVFEFEPEPHPGLLELDNVCLTPHVGSATSDARVDMVMSVFANIESFLKTGQAINLCKAS
ncbi:D-glycerate dehydrogenase [Parahaliea sp. F7430]|uniref:D-glycerate dehydrogenase n=1 Tax=Sediminihaliea albiluteola TaxID=2758564 RepID=A0A7W2TUM8_9GAMM|nr:D-glycerate dehydrogenase [Sediminihaliea albiluteola]MBA6412275.1 D-glycerate dehydrogenase [Sediminihaliea albiluteola]